MSSEILKNYNQKLKEANEASFKKNEAKLPLGRFTASIVGCTMGEIKKGAKAGGFFVKILCKVARGNLLTSPPDKITKEHCGFVEEIMFYFDPLPEKATDKNEVDNVFKLMNIRRWFLQRAIACAINGNDPTKNTQNEKNVVFPTDNAIKEFNDVLDNFDFYSKKIVGLWVVFEKGATASKDGSKTFDKYEFFPHPGGNVLEDDIKALEDLKKLQSEQTNVIPF